MGSFLRILRDFDDNWLSALIDLLRRLIALLCNRKHRTGVASRDQGPCVQLNSPVFIHPDPLIYDQYYLMSLGLAVTWDNPDIQLFLQGVPVSSSDLQTNTEYQIVARIWNASTDAPVAALPVIFSYLSFGIGTQSHSIGQTTVDLGVKGSPNEPAFAVMSWTTPATPGHYCIQVFLDPVDDANWQNNLGQENTQVGHAHSAATFTFALRNDADERRPYSFQIDAYELGAPPPCPPPQGETQESTAASLPAILAALPAELRRGNQPLPPGWRVGLDTLQPTLEGGEEITVSVTVEPPVGFSGQQTVNVNAFTSGALAGGVTLTVIV